MPLANTEQRRRNELAARAGRQGRSLQEFMLQEVAALAGKPAVADLVAEVREHWVACRPVRWLVLS